MTKHFLLCFTLLGAAAWPHASNAQEDSKKDGDAAALLRQAARPNYDEIERGLWFALEAGALGHVDWISTLPPTRLPRQLLPDDAGPGIRMGGRVGYDVMKLFSIDGFMLGQFRDKRIRRGRDFTGDLTDFTGGVGIRLMPITIKDRLSFTGRASLGLSMLFPGEVARANSNPGCLPPLNAKEAINPMCVALPTIATPVDQYGIQPFPGTVLAISPMAEVMVGVEYFTKLRHFSVGADLVVGTLFWPLSLHVGIVPHVKYSF